MKKRLTMICLCAALLLSVLSGCSAADDANSDSATSDTAAGQLDGDIVQTSAESSEYDLTFTDRELDGSWDGKADAVITLSDSGSTVSGSGVKISGSEITITAAGTYELRGSLSDGSVIVDATSDDKVRLVLNGASIYNSDGAAVYIAQADKVFITLAEGSDNSISCGSQFSAEAEEIGMTAAIFSKDDLAFNGEGSLSITAPYRHAIASKDDLVVTGGSYTISAASDGLHGKDCVKICGGTFVIDAGGDGIQSDNEAEAGRGFVYISKGSFNINCTESGIQAETLLRIDGGQFEIVSVDDNLHTNGSAEIYGGELTLSTGDDGIHADDQLLLAGGRIDVLESYEGFEALGITITGGSYSITASDDGMNAAGGADSSGNNGWRKQDMFSATEGAFISIEGGYIYVNASGDGIDSNGELTISGGVLLVSGPTDSANGALDYQSSMNIKGGIVMVCEASNAMGINFGFGSVDSFEQTMMSASVSGTGGTRLTLCDSNGNVLASFVPDKSYGRVYISAPDLSDDGTYYLFAGGSADSADDNGFAGSGTLADGVQLGEISASTGSAGTGGKDNMPDRGGFSGGAAPR